MSARSAHDLLRQLFLELYQTERSTALHCRREAERLAGTPPAAALWALADHATQVLQELPALGERTGMTPRSPGTILEAWLSAIRDKLADRGIDEEHSYRATLLGARDGADLVHLIQHAANQVGDEVLARFCLDWLDTRLPLLKALEDELSWFAGNVDRAMSPATYWMQRALRLASR